LDRSSCSDFSGKGVVFEIQKYNAVWGAGDQKPEMCSQYKITFTHQQMHVTGFVTGIAVGVTTDYNKLFKLFTWDVWCAIASFRCTYTAYV